MGKIMSHTIKSPFSPEQIASLEGFQECKSLHSFTCGDCGADLKPTQNGWICSVSDCEYTQDWCHDFMADNSWKPGHG